MPKSEQSKTIILCYHSISENDGYNLGINPVHPTNFRLQMEYIKNNFEVVPMSDLSDQDFGRNRAIITFDDGYLDNFNIAANILSELDLPASFYISPFFTEFNLFFYTDLIAFLFSNNTYDDFLKTFGYSGIKNKSYQSEIQRVSLFSHSELRTFILNINKFIKPRDFKLLLPALTSKDVIQLHNNELFELGSHSYLHSRYSNFREVDFLRDIEEGIHFFRKFNLATNKFFPFPFGDFNSFDTSISKILLSTYGLRSMSTTPLFYNKNNDSYVLPRLSVQNWNLKDFVKILKFIEWLSRSSNLSEYLLKTRFNLKNFFYGVR